MKHHTYYRSRPVLIHLHRRHNKTTVLGVKGQIMERRAHNRKAWPMPWCKQSGKAGERAVHRLRSGQVRNQLVCYLEEFGHPLCSEKQKSKAQKRG